MTDLPRSIHSSGVSHNPWTPFRGSGHIPSIDAIETSLRNLQSNLLAVDRDRPQYRDYISNLEEQRTVFDNALHANFDDIQALYEQERELARLRDIDVARGRVVGRISLWLESVAFNDDLAELQQCVSAAEHDVLTLEGQLDPDEKQQRLVSILTYLGQEMTQWAQRLRLEYVDAESFVVFDWSKATIAVQTASDLIPLRQMGSGENWLGYHLLVHLALHKHFVERNRPTPRFLFLDQPTQVYFPDDEQESDPINESGTLSDLSEDDRRSVERTFGFIFDIVESLAPNLQVIISDHADLGSDPRFQSAVQERWRHGVALIPQEWLD